MTYSRTILLASLLAVLLCACQLSPHQTRPSAAQIDLENETIADENTAYPASDPYGKAGDPPLDDSEGLQEAAAEPDVSFESENGEVDPSGEDKQPSTAGKQPALDQALDYCQAAQDFWQKGELENALQALDDAYALILEVDTSDNPKLIQQKEDLRFSISKRILEIYASRNIVVNGNHKAIPITINKHVQNEIDRFTTGRDRRFFMDAYRRSGRYRPYIVQQLKAAGLPESLSWLPLIESGFKTGALSKARALGLWQFIPSTGYKFGLKRDLYIDERLDPVKSTDAAIDYLKELHQIFGDWTTVLAAYNCGEGRVLRIIRSQNVNYLDNFWDLYERLPWETARYVPKFLAAVHIINNLQKYDMEGMVPDPPMVYEAVDVHRQVHLKQIADSIGVPEKTLVDLNTELRYKMLPPDKYPLRVPPEMASSTLAQIDKIPVSSPPRHAFVYHRVRRGQTLSTIAERYRTSVLAIARANNISRRNHIVAGKLLKIPQRGSAYSRPTYSPANRYATTHTVQRGDSLWIIAKKYGTTTSKIQELNNLKTSNLYIGQTLKLPGYGWSADELKNYRVYRVQPGDSPFAIAMKHNMNLKHFLQINRLQNHSTIYPGQNLYVK